MSHEDTRKWARMCNIPESVTDEQLFDFQRLSRDRFLADQHLSNLSTIYQRLKDQDKRMLKIESEQIGNNTELGAVIAYLNEVDSEGNDQAVHIFISNHIREKNKLTKDYHNKLRLIEKGTPDVV